MCGTHLERLARSPFSPLLLQLLAELLLILQNMDEGRAATGPRQGQDLLLEPWAEGQNPSPRTHATEEGLCQPGLLPLSPQTYK